MAPGQMPDGCAFASGPFVSADADRAVVWWSTTRPGSAEVAARSGPGFAPASDGILATEHRVALGGLQRGASYEIEARSTCPGVPGAASRKVWFTARPNTPPAIVEGPAAGLFGVGRSAAVLSWKTDEPTEARIDLNVALRPVQLKRQPLLRTEHFFLLGGLEPDVLYRYLVTSCDAFGECAYRADATFATTPFSGSPVPVFTEGPAADSLDVTDSTALVRWRTDEPASSFVQYRTETDLPLTAGASALGTEHLVLLAGLRPATAYEYRALSADAENNAAFSGPAAPHDRLGAGCGAAADARRPAQGQRAQAGADAAAAGHVL
jgi:hypothetical protein